MKIMAAVTDSLVLKGVLGAFVLYVVTFIAVMAFLLVFALAFPAFGDSFTMHPTIPGTSIRDFSKPGFNVDTDRGTIQPTIPGTSIRDFGRSGYRIERRGSRTQLQPTIPGTNIRDWSKPGYTFD